MQLDAATTTLLVFLTTALRRGSALATLFGTASDRYLEEDVVTDTICKLAQPGGGNVTGVLSFHQDTPDDLVTISGDLSGLSPGLHGFHIHMKGDLTNGCESTGHHFDVGRGMWHGARTDVVRHVGDLGNVEADARGDAQFVIFDRLLSLNGPNSIVGRSAIVHRQEDDLGLGGTAESRETGRSGSIIACGVIGIAQP